MRRRFTILPVASVIAVMLAATPAVADDPPQRRLVAGAALETGCAIYVGARNACRSSVEVVVGIEAWGGVAVTPNLTVLLRGAARGHMTVIHGSTLEGGAAVRLSPASHRVYVEPQVGVSRWKGEFDGLACMGIADCPRAWTGAAIGAAAGVEIIQADHVAVELRGHVSWSTLGEHDDEIEILAGLGMSVF